MHQRLQKNVTYNKFAELLLVIPDINACACIFYLHQPCQQSTGLIYFSHSQLGFGIPKRDITKTRKS